MKSRKFLSILGVMLVVTGFSGTAHALRSCNLEGQKCPCGGYDGVYYTASETVQSNGGNACACNCSKALKKINNSVINGSTTR